MQDPTIPNNQSPLPTQPISPDMPTNPAMVNPSVTPQAAGLPPMSGQAQEKPEEKIDGETEKTDQTAENDNFIPYFEDDNYVY